MGIITPLRGRPRALEFFAGIGLARVGLERAGFDVAWSNDYEPDKHAMYAAHFRDGQEHTYVVGDIGNVKAQDLPQDAALAWASSPCTDLSLAGSRAGLAGKESNAFWLWTRLLRDMGDSRPPVVVLENVTGLATSHGGDDLRAAIRELNDLGYSVDLLSLDARRFLPQSRPRMFVVGAQNPPSEASGTSALRPDWVQSFYGDPSLRMHKAELPQAPEFVLHGFSTLVEDVPLSDERWWDTDRTEAFVRSLSPTQLERIRALKLSPEIQYRTAYRRTRNGIPVWEVRADDIAGCLRTARGGSSKQAVVRIGSGRIRVRWMTPLEYARLMGAGDFNLAGARNNQALFAFGDAVAVPAVAWLADNYLMPLINGELGSQVARRLLQSVQ
ncbi:DNA cytosine methyltransferase [Microbacterium wangruii]|uniref:DNA cytosine methyltransferase n=1 Tax=Microbacterium wangruii TaxID=3049073 RepID=UPI00256EB5BE|nr:DNA cytosine methyltransferase [Microbacterium sp. zg-Y1211]MDL5486020.1 DNA cytosine methyltransferase [Microbacterium sp. zg-Y1211]